ncbi:MAG: hypothetical protein RJB66_362 [Pseudomonadota bacterium]|jgi:predicted deacylase
MNSKIYFNPTWAKTRQGLNIPLWSSQAPETLHGRQGRNPILFIGGVHGDEPEGVWLAEAFLNAIQTEYLKRAHTTSSTWPGRNWILIPCLNPEGYERQERTNSAGVDLNRNFPSTDWSPEAKAPRYNPGAQPGSEPEVQATIRAINLFKPELIIHFHSWQPCVVYTGSPGASVARQIGEHAGYEYREDIGYPTPGSLGQYGWLNHKTPVICIEEREGTARELIWPRFEWALMDLLK